MKIKMKFGILSLSFGIAFIIIGVANALNNVPSKQLFILFTIATILTVAGLTMLTATQETKGKNESPNEERLNQLERLSSLFEKGLINEAEFIQQKRKIL